MFDLFAFPVGTVKSKNVLFIIRKYYFSSVSEVWKMFKASNDSTSSSKSRGSIVGRQNGGFFCKEAQPYDSGNCRKALYL